MRTRPALAAMLASVLVVPSVVRAAPVLAATPAGAVVAAGTVLDISGQPVPGRLELLAWPPTHELEVGDRVELVPLATGAADDDGDFSLHALPGPEVLSAAADQGGYVNLELRTIADGRYTATHFSRHVGGPVRPFGAQGQDAWEARPGEAAPPLEVRLPARPVTAQAIMPMVSMRCGPYELKEKRSADTVIGELRTPPDTTQAVFTYGRRADSDISVGMRYSGGGWSISGEHHVSNSGDDAVDQDAKPMSAEDLILRSSFEYGRFEQDCYDVHTEQVRSLGWAGHTMLGERTIDIGCSGAPREHLGRYGAGGGFKRVEERAATWGGAAEAFGFSVSARSGYSNYVHLRMKFGDEPMHVVCGDNNHPNLSRRIFAGESAPVSENCRPGRPC